MSTRTAHGEVSIRGLNTVLNNRTLVLMDGQPLLNSFFDFVTWEGIPVTRAAIDRIEIVEGPTSAVHGANAINGVINLITRTPQEIDGGGIRVAAGERNMRQMSALIGAQHDRIGYRAGAEWKDRNRFSDGDLRASRTLALNGQFFYRADPRSQVSVSVGLADMSTDTRQVQPVPESTMGLPASPGSTPTGGVSA